MKEEIDEYQKFEDLMMEKYPSLFYEEDGKPVPPECGLSCPPGWRKMVDDLCGAIVEHVNCTYPKPRDVKIAQVKSKFGTLRFYTDGHDDIVGGMIRMAEYISAILCEQCGERGKLCAKRGWYVTHCPECNKKFGSKALPPAQREEYEH